MTLLSAPQLPSTFWVATFSASASEPAVSASPYLNVSFTGAENAVPSGPSRYATPTPPGAWLVIGAMLSSCEVCNAPAGTSSVKRPSALTSVPPVVGTIACTASPVAVPTGVIAISLAGSGWGCEPPPQLEPIQTRATALQTVRVFMGNLQQHLEVPLTSTLLPSRRMGGITREI